MVVELASGPRRLAVLDRRSAEAYTRCVAAVAPAIEAALGPEVLANRVRSADPALPGLRLEPWRSARLRFGSRLRSIVRGAEMAVIADVHACYPSIEPGVVGAALRAIGCDRAQVRGVTSLLDRFAEGGVPGLPVGPDPSAVLANAVLAHVDRALRRFGARHVRWVDDVVAVPPDGTRGQAALSVLRFALAELGLELAERKTRVLLDPDRVARTLRPSGPRPAVTLRADALPVPGRHRAHALLPADGGVGAGRRPARPAGGIG